MVLAVTLNIVVEKMVDQIWRLNMIRVTEGWTAIYLGVRLDLIDHHFLAYLCQSSGNGEIEC